MRDGASLEVRTAGLGDPQQRSFGESGDRDEPFAELRDRRPFFVSDGSATRGKVRSAAYPERMTDRNPTLASPAVLDISPHPVVLAGKTDGAPAAETWRLVADRWERGLDLPVPLMFPKARLVDGKIALVGTSPDAAHHLWLDPASLEVTARLDFDHRWLSEQWSIDRSGRIFALLHDDSRARIEEHAGPPPQMLNLTSPPPGCHFNVLEGPAGWLAWEHGTPDGSRENDVWLRRYQGWERIARIPAGRLGICHAIAQSPDSILFVRTDGGLLRLDDAQRVSTLGSLEPSADAEAFWGGVSVTLDGSRLYAIRADVARCLELDSLDEPVRDLVPPEHERMGAHLLPRSDGSYWIVGGFGPEKNGRPAECWRPQVASAEWVAQRASARARQEAEAQRAASARRERSSAPDWMTPCTPVRIVEGPFARVRGTIERVEGSIVHVGVSIFGRATTATVQVSQVERDGAE